MIATPLSPARGVVTYRIALCGALLFGGCDSTATSAAGSDIKRATYPTIETNFIVHNMPISGEIEWIDNDRVIFSGYEPGIQDTLSGGASSLKRGIYIFDGKSKIGKRHADGTLDCFSRGYIHYRRKNNDGTETTLAGMLGQEKELDSASIPKYGVQSKVSCRVYEKHQLPELAGIPAKPLLPEHGYLLLAPLTSEHDNFIRLVAPNGKQRTLPVRHKDLRSAELRWYEHENAYLLYDRTPSEVSDRTVPLKPKRVGIAKTLHVIEANGSYRTLKVPYHVWHRGLGKFYLAKSAIVMVSRVRGRSRSPHYEEVFLIRGRYWESILAGGATSDAAVSPDGCKLALGIAKAPQVNLQPVLHVVNLCE